MARRTPWEDEFTLLCERCGYVLEGLDPGGRCPECATPIEESLPERRAGTPWQRRQGIGTLIRTWWVCLIHPHEALRSIRPVCDRCRTLALITCAVSATIMVGSIAVHKAVELDSPAWSATTRSKLAGWAIEGLGWWAGVLIALWILTRIETSGLKFFGARRGARITTDLSLAITSHGCVGWLLGSILFVLGNVIARIVLGLVAPRVTIRSSDYATMEAFLEAIRNAPMPTTPAWVEYMVISAPWIGFSVGFLFFEVFAYLGLRRLKYANRVRPPTESETPEPTIHHA